MQSCQTAGFGLCCGRVFTEEITKDTLFLLRFLPKLKPTFLSRFMYKSYKDLRFFIKILLNVLVIDIA